MKNNNPQQMTALALLAIVVTGLLLDLSGLTWGLPEGDWHWDEKVRLVLQMMKNKTLNPHYFINPALHSYIVGMCLLPYMLFLKLSGALHNVSAWAQLADTVKTNIMLIGRMVSVCLGIGTGYIVYRMGKKLFGPPVGLLAGEIGRAHV